MPIYRTSEGQNIFDIALQIHGKAEKAIQIMVGNLGKIPSLNSYIKGGTELQYIEEVTPLVQYYKNKKITICTNDDKEIEGRAFDDSFDVSFN